jgi:hypothetical protein
MVRSFRRQPVGDLQLIRNVVDHRLNPQQVCDAPKRQIKLKRSLRGIFCIFRSSVLFETF